MVTFLRNKGDRAGQSLDSTRFDKRSTQRSYTYTDDGLLEYAYDGNNNVIGSFTWDADKNRVGMVMGGGTYSFVYDRTAGIPAVIEEKNEGGSAVYYFREPSGSLLARLKGSDWRWYHFDELGSTRLLTDGSGNATDGYAYDAYGHLLSHTDPDPTDGVDMTTDNPYQYVGRLGYYTHWQAPEFGLLQLGVRFYDPEVGRFTQADQITVDREGRFAYSGNSPLVGTDPSGLYTTQGDCTNCDFDSAIQEIKKRMRKKKCRDAIHNVAGCLGFMSNPWPWMNFYCGALKDGHAAETCSKNNISFDCNTFGGFQWETLLHEMMHACWFKAGKPYNPSETGFPCYKEGCINQWPAGNDKQWEWTAEKVVHACED